MICPKCRSDSVREIGKILICDRCRRAYPPPEMTKREVIEILRPAYSIKELYELLDAKDAGQRKYIRKVYNRKLPCQKKAYIQNSPAQLEKLLKEMLAIIWRDYVKFHMDLYYLRHSVDRLVDAVGDLNLRLAKLEAKEKTND